jgi:uncharacterized protein
MDFEAAKLYALNYIETKVEKYFYYHNIHHTIDVYQSVTELAKSENVNGKDLILLQTAALYHDLGIRVIYDLHEEVSVSIVRSVLPDFGFSEEDIEKVCHLVLATKLNSSPQDKLSQLLCDADLDYLGRPDYFRISIRLRQEWDTLKIKTFTDKEWNLFQIDFLENHKYYLQNSRLARDDGKSSNIIKIKALL